MIESPLARYIGFLLRRTYVRANEIAQQVMPAGTHPRDFAVLSALVAHDAVSQQDLAVQLDINRTMMVKALDNLERKGFVRRQRSPTDRRSHIVSITDAGRAAIEAMAPAVTAGEQQLTAALTDNERVRLNELLAGLFPDLDRSLPFKPTQRSGYLLVKGHFKVRHQVDAVLNDVGLQSRHFGALATIGELEPASQQQVARRLGAPETAAVSLVDYLEDQALVVRERNPDDRRQYALRLTPEGTERLARATTQIDALHAELEAKIGGPAGGTELRKLLIKLIEAVDG